MLVLVFSLLFLERGQKKGGRSQRRGGESFVKEKKNQENIQKRGRALIQREKKREKKKEKKKEKRKEMRGMEEEGGN